MKEVYLDRSKNTLSFVFRQNENVCVGETDGSLADFIESMRTDWVARGIEFSEDELPKPEES